MIRVLLGSMLVALASVLAVTTAVFAQVPLAVYHRPFNVERYDLTLNWMQTFVVKKPVMSGRNVITLTLTDTASAVALDAMQMRLDSVRVNGLLVAPLPQPAADTVLIPITDASLRKKGQRLTLEVSYTRTSTAQDGLYVYPKGQFVGFGPRHDSVFVEEDLAYTMSEPQDARKWMPCNDDPDDKADSRISIMVPVGYSAQSNGLLQSIDSSVPGRRVYVWQSDRPIATYLMCAHASTWIEWKDSYVRASVPHDTVPVIYFAWPKDYYDSDMTGMGHNARYAFRNTPKMVAYYSSLFGEYPFAQYGQVPVQPFGYGGMEHQTMTTMDRAILHGNDEDVIAHELFHQWFGDKTTCETWSDIWLNEGFATFGEMLWEESRRGVAGYDSILQTKAREFLHPWNNQYANRIPIYAPPIDLMFSNDYLVVYHKPGMVIHMLRRMLANDTLFFNTIRDYSSTFAYSTANTFQFRDYIEGRAGQKAPMSLFEYINEWMFRPDWPIYQITWGQEASNKLSLRIRQVQDSSDHYTMPVRFKAVAGTDTTELVFLNNSRVQDFSAYLTKQIDTLIFDDEALVLSEHTVLHDPRLRGVEVTGTTAGGPGTLEAYHAGDEVRFAFTPVGRGTVTAPMTGGILRVIDLLGRVRAEVLLRSGDVAAAISERNLTAGDYFAILRDAAGERHARFVVGR